MKTFEVQINTFYTKIWSQAYRGQGVDCGGLTENDSQRLTDLNTWLSVGRTIPEGLGGVTLLEEVYHWGQALRF